VTSLKERIEAKARRSVSLPILVGDASSAIAAVTEALRALQNYQNAAPEEPDDEFRAEEQRLRDGVDEAVAAQREMIVQVKLQALPADEWEAVFGGVEPDEDGELALDDFRAALLAACCVDEDLRDEKWWEEQLSGPQWTKGEKIAADRILLDLNLSAPAGSPGKG
jgi:hypothetical protein